MTRVTLTAEQADAINAHHAHQQYCEQEYKAGDPIIARRREDGSIYFPLCNGDHEVELAPPPQVN